MAPVEVLEAASALLRKNYYGLTKPQFDLACSFAAGRQAGEVAAAFAYSPEKFQAYLDTISETLEIAARRPATSASSAAETIGEAIRELDAQT
jgi:hypothetical protein